MKNQETTSTGKKWIVNVAWNREAANIMETKGFKALKEAAKNNDFYTFDSMSFDTEKEAMAYCRGISDGCGWDSPEWEIKEK